MRKLLFCLALLGVILASLNCFRKEKEDEVSKIREVMGVFSRGLSQNSKTVMDSVCIKDISQNILNEIYVQKKIIQPQITERKFAIYGKQAEVRFVLRDERNQDASPPSVKLTLTKKWGKWRIVNFEME